MSLPTTATKPFELRAFRTTLQSKNKRRARDCNDIKLRLQGRIRELSTAHDEYLLDNTSMDLFAASAVR